MKVLGRQRITKEDHEAIAKGRKELVATATPLRFKAIEDAMKSARKDNRMFERLVKKHMRPCSGCGWGLSVGMWLCPSCDKRRVRRSSARSNHG